MVLVLVVVVSGGRAGRNRCGIELVSSSSVTSRQPYKKPSVPKHPHYGLFEHPYYGLFEFGLNTHITIGLNTYSTVCEHLYYGL